RLRPAGSAFRRQRPGADPARSSLRVGSRVRPAAVWIGTRAGPRADAAAAVESPDRRGRSGAGLTFQQGQVSPESAIELWMAMRGSRAAVDAIRGLPDAHLRRSHVPQG